MSALFTAPIPSLSESLGDGSRADGFEEWVAENLRVQELDLTEDERSALRMLRLFLIAMVEGARIEVSTHGRDFKSVAALMPQVAGGAVMAAVMSVTAPGASYMRMARLLGEEFTRAAKTMGKASSTTPAGRVS